MPSGVKHYGLEQQAIAASMYLDAYQHSMLSDGMLSMLSRQHECVFIMYNRVVRAPRP